MKDYRPHASFHRTTRLRSAKTLLGLLVVPLIAITVSVVTMPAQADDYPSKPITLLFGFSVGSGGDIAARLEAKAMSDELGVPVVVRNVPGAGGRNAVTILNRSKPDGYTMGIINVPGQLVNQLIRGLPPICVLSNG